MSWYTFYSCILLLLISTVNVRCLKHPREEIKKCQLNADLRKRIQDYKPVVDRIINTAVNGEFKGYVHKELTAFIDKFGARLTGTSTLEHSIDYMMDKLSKLKLDNVHTEPVEVPFWERGKESAFMIKPRRQKLNMLGLGDSPSTPEDGITASVLVVDTFDELKAKKAQVPGKIVVFNERFISYGETVPYRSLAMGRVSKLGGLAVLVASITPFSIGTPHTGSQNIPEDGKLIPSACITVEDARMLRRIQDGGGQITITLNMKNRSTPPVPSRNTVAEIKGSSRPRDVVLLSGHMDSWDVGQGAMDDGGGAFISWGALALLKHMELVPRRTVRCVLWTGEEQGYIGAKEYAKNHAGENANFNLIVESDEGTFLPLGIEFEGTDEGACIMKEITKLLQAINATQTVKTQGVGSDIQVFAGKGIPLADLYNKNDKYFYYHHTDGDTMEVELPENLDRGVAVFAAVGYVAADLIDNIPRL